MLYLRARYYIPNQGRFLTRDTWAGTYTRPASLHRYTYAENNPVLYTDPSGQCIDPDYNGLCYPGSGSNNPPTISAPTPPTASAPTPYPYLPLPYCLPIVIAAGLPCIPLPCPVLPYLVPPANPNESQMIEFIASFGLTLQGDWTGTILANLWEALFTHIGPNDLRSWLHGRTATLVWGGKRNCGEKDACYGGLTSGDKVTFTATGTTNSVINILHEFGHLVDNLWGDYFTNSLEKTEFTLDGAHLAGWNGTAYVSLPSSGLNNVRTLALISPNVGGGDAWQQRGGNPYWEDWGDIFANGIIGNINQASDLGGQMGNFYDQMVSHVIGGAP